ncbi:hypothetical protein TRFO_22937 [Tritrichomonas foetus]|uniref:KATNIP domain-containing protein n=1 Tax=Tritrichomonas foetus TaxID=1144522 RepID=A0A1J4KFH1_9EUKA|nr:hypothetical protein TRFO_22937 [Tritrichomonas foetus]|eukprot:OHT08516.1 hypothetical protein TRFO_22937 [Tritrichomonas foetus]
MNMKSLPPLPDYVSPVARKNPKIAAIRKYRNSVGMGDIASLAHSKENFGLNGLRKEYPSNGNNLNGGVLGSSMNRQSMKLVRNTSCVTKTPKLNNHTQKLSRLRAASQTPKCLPMPEIDYSVTVHMKSTWGKSEFISCSEIDFLNRDRTPLSNVTISCLNRTDTPAHLSLLCNRTLVKNEEECWRHKWPPENETSLNFLKKYSKNLDNQNDNDTNDNNDDNNLDGYEGVTIDAKELVLKFDFRSEKLPEFVRIWNGKLDKESQLKDFEVWCNGHLLYQGVVPCEFGINAPIKIDPAMVHPELENKSISSVVDKILKTIDHDGIDEYGEMPLMSTKNVTIEIIENFKGEDRKIGLNCIQFFGENGKEISLSQIKNVALKRATCVNSAFNLLKDHRRTMDEEEMWVAKKEKPSRKNSSKNSPFNGENNSSNSEEKISLIFEFLNKKKIILIRFWNYNGQKIDIGTKKMAIYFGDHRVWVGPLRKAKGMTSRISEGVTDIWFADKHIFKDKDEIEFLTTTREPGEEQLIC